MLLDSTWHMLFWSSIVTFWLNIFNPIFMQRASYYAYVEWCTPLLMSNSTSITYPIFFIHLLSSFLLFSWFFKLFYSYLFLPSLFSPTYIIFKPILRPSWAYQLTVISEVVVISGTRPSNWPFVVTGSIAKGQHELFDIASGFKICLLIHCHGYFILCKV